MSNRRRVIFNIPVAGHEKLKVIQVAVEYRLGFDGSAPTMRPQRGLYYSATAGSWLRPRPPYGDLVVPHVGIEQHAVAMKRFNRKTLEDAANSPDWRVVDGLFDELDRRIISVEIVRRVFVNGHVVDDNPQFLIDTLGANPSFRIDYDVIGL